MNPIKLTNKTRTMGEGQPGVQPLDVVDLAGPYGNEMTSVWKPEAEELAALNAGGAVQLSVMIPVNVAPPPCYVGVQAAQALPDATIPASMCYNAATDCFYYSDTMEKVAPSAAAFWHLRRHEFPTASDVLLRDVPPAGPMQ